MVKGDDALRIHVTGSVILAVLLVLALAASLRPWPDTLFRVDFISFWTGASIAWEKPGPALMDVEEQRAFQIALRRELATTEEMRRATGYFPYYNPPPLALIFVPLTLLPLPWAYVVWSAISLLMMLVAVLLPLRGCARARTLAPVLLTFGGVAGTLLEGQVNSLFLLAFSLGLLALTRGRRVTGGALLGILLLKPQYAAPFALVLLVKRRWRELVGMMAVGVAIGIMSLLMVGPTGLGSFFGELRRISAFRPPASALVSLGATVNWRALLLNLWPSVTDGVGGLLVVLLGGATILAALLAWRGDWMPESPRFSRQMLALTLATVVASLPQPLPWQRTAACAARPATKRLRLSKQPRKGLAYAADCRAGALGPLVDGRLASVADVALLPAGPGLLGLPGCHAGTSSRTGHREAGG